MVTRYGRIRGEILLNSTTAQGQGAPSMAATAAGGFIAVWTDNSGLGGDASSSSIKGQRLDAAGNKIGGEFLVNTTHADTQSDSRIIVLPSGKFVVTWTDFRSIDPSTVAVEVRGRLFNADGTPAGNDFLVNTVTDGFQNQSNVAALAGGGFVVTWTDGSLQGGDAVGLAVKGQLFSASAAKVGGQFLVNTTTAGSQSGPSVAALAGGGFVVAWTDTSQTGGDLSLGAIRLQQYSAAGAKVGGEKLVNTVTDQMQNGANVAALEGGGFVILWTDASKNGDPSLAGIKGQLFNASGARVGTEFLANSEHDGDQRRPRASALPDGGFIVTWESATASGTSHDVKAQIFDSAGAKVGSEFRVTADASGSQSLHNVVTLASGDVAIAWTDLSGRGGDISGTAIRAQVIGVSTAAPSDIALSNASVSETAVENQAVATLSTAGVLNSEFTYTIVSDSTGGAFAIVDDGLVVQDNSRLDFETSSTAQVRIRTTDADGKSFEEMFQLAITDTPEQGYQAGPEFLVNTTTQNDQSLPELALLKGGELLVLWAQSAPFSNAVGKAKVLNSDGNPVTNELSVDGAFAVAALPGGGFVTVGSASAASGAGAALHFYSASGTPTGSETPIFSQPGGDQLLHSLAVLKSGVIVAAWMDSVHHQGFNTEEIRGQLFSATGTPIGPDFMVNTSNFQEVAHPQVAALASGGFVVAWQDGGAIRAQLFRADGQRLGSEFLVNPPTDYMFDPQVTALTGGGFVVTWIGNAFFSFTAQIFDADGIKVGDPIAVGQISQVHSTDVAALSWGGFVVGWDPYEGTAASGSGVRAQVFDATGARVGAELRANLVAAGNQSMVGVVGLDSGAFAVGWADRNPAGDGSGASVKTKIFTPVMPGANPPATSGDDQLIGTSVADSLNGLAGNDLLDGRAGADTMTGGTGNDTYVVGSSGDKVVETSAAGGVDLVRSAISYTLGDHVEDLVLTGFVPTAATGNALANKLTGNSAANLLDGGAGADTMTGAAGSDTYVVDNAGDKVVETSSAGGSDTVRSRISYTLGSHVEKLVLTGTAAINGTGNSLANTITGNAAANGLDGGSGNDTLDGGAGADTMAGGSGDDLFIVDNVADKAIESSPTGGTDTVRSAVTFTLGANLEKLILTGIAVIDGTGNALANSLIGNGEANLLNGGGAADTMTGGSGNDIYVVDNSGDKVIEADAGGSDTVRSAVSHTLAANVEKLLLTGSAAINGTGNGLANGLTGNGAANVLKGVAGNDTIDGGSGDDRLFGGAGNDVLKGGSGLDQFLFDAALGASNVDALSDFSAPSDGIHLDRAIFTRAGVNGTLSASAFHKGAAAADAGDRIVYDQAAGKIFYDSDGNGAAAAILFATVAPGTTLTNADFIIYG